MDAFLGLALLAGGLVVIPFARTKFANPDGAPASGETLSVAIAVAVTLLFSLGAAELVRFWAQVAAG